MSWQTAVKRQLRSVIQWEEGSEDHLFWRWTENGDEIKNASKLIVGPGQGCVFVYEGVVQSVWSEPGMYELSTDNVPFWTTIKKFMQAFESEHKVGIYFFRTAQMVNQKWGTSKAIKYKDPVYRLPVELKCFGNYSIEITDAKHFFTKILAGAAAYSFSDLRTFLLSRIEPPIKDYLAEAKHSYVDIDSQLDEIAAEVTVKLNGEFSVAGFNLVDFRINGTSFDEKTQARIDKIADATAEAASMAELGISYERKQQLDAMKMAAQNEGGAAGLGMSLGTGLAAGQAMGGVFAGLATNTALQLRPRQ